MGGEMPEDMSSMMGDMDMGEDGEGVPPEGS